MDVLISRQAAIDELIKMLGDCFQADEELVDAVVTTQKNCCPEKGRLTARTIQKHDGDILSG